MPKAPVQVTFARSRVALGLYGVIGSAIALACILWLSTLWAGVVFLVLVALGEYQARRLPPPLRTTDSGQWEQYLDGQWRGVALEVSRLGPLLCEVRIERRHYALWYDMLPPEQFRRLRQALLNRSATGNNIPGELPQG